MAVASMSLSWVLVALCIGAYFYVKSKTGCRLVFWPVLAAGLAMFALVATPGLSAATAGILRIAGYVFILGSFVVLMLTLRQLREAIARAKG